MENFINQIDRIKKPNEDIKDNNELKNEEINDLAIDNINNNVENISVVNNNVENLVEKKVEDISINPQNVKVASDVNTDTIFIQQIENIILNNGIKEMYDALDINKQKKIEVEIKKTSLEISKILLKVKNNILSAVNKIFLLIKKLMLKFSFSDYGYTEKIIKNKVEEIINLKKEDKK